jgi:hypothetical protein
MGSTIQNDSMHARRIRGKNLCTYGEYAKRILAYSPNMPRDIKLGIFQLIMEQKEKTSDSLFLSLMGLNKPKNHFTLLANRNCKHFRGKNRRFIASEEVTGRIFTIID